MRSPSIMHTPRTIILFALILLPLLMTGALAQKVTYRLTVQIHEGPGFNLYYLFYIANFQLPDENGTLRQVVLSVPHGDEEPREISAFPLDNSSLTIEVQESSGASQVTVTTNGTEFEVRYFIPAQASVLRSDDHQLTFPAPEVENELRGMTIAINWPNWKYQIHRIEPDGAEMVMNPMFETDPYKSVSYYWYFSGSEADQAGIDEISVTLRSAATTSRVSRNQTIIILVLVVVVPAGIFIAVNPPKKMKETERQRKFRITDERDIRAKKRRERYKGS